MFTGHVGPVNSASFSADGAHVVTASDDTTARLWAAKPGVLLEQKGHNGWVRTVDVSSDNTRIITGSDDSTAWAMGREDRHQTRPTGRERRLDSRRSIQP